MIVFDALAFHTAADATNDAADHDELHAAADVIRSGATGSVYVHRWLVGLAQRHGIDTGPVEAPCGCWTCRYERSPALVAQQMVVCPECGYKRCPKATHHVHECTGSNDAGQPGSRYGGLDTPGAYTASLAEAAGLADEANRRTE